MLTVCLYKKTNQVEGITIPTEMLAARAPQAKKSGFACQWLGNSYSMGCPPVRGDNPRALASGLSYVQVDKHGITILYHLHQCRPCTSSDISC